MARRGGGATRNPLERGGLVRVSGVRVSIAFVSLPIYHSTYSTTASAKKHDILAHPRVESEIHVVKFARRAGENSNDMAISTEENLSHAIGPWSDRVALMDCE